MCAAFAAALSLMKGFKGDFMGRKYKGNQHYIMRYHSPIDNLLYNILLQALRDNDIEYLKHGDGLLIWKHLKGVKQK